MIIKVKYDEFVTLRKERREQQLRAYEKPAKNRYRIRKSSSSASATKATKSRAGAEPYQATGEDRAH